MAQTQAQLLFRRGPSTVIQGKRREIAAQLDKLDDEDELTLIVPGKAVEAGLSGKGESFDAVFGPLQKGFRRERHDRRGAWCIRRRGDRSRSRNTPR